jgi:hypothetical protein
LTAVNNVRPPSDGSPYGRLPMTVSPTAASRIERSSGATDTAV